MKLKFAASLLATVALVGSHAMAQGGNPLSNAILSQRGGDLAKAKDHIDKTLSLKPEEAKNPKYWFYKGSIYYALTNAQDKNKALAGDSGALVTLASLSKVFELEANSKSKEYSDQAKRYRNDLYAMLFNAGGATYNEGGALEAKEDKAGAAAKYMSAYNHFTKAAELRPKDTTAYVYAIAAAYKLNNGPAGEDVLALEEKLAGRKPSLGSFINVAQIYQAQQQREGLQRVVAAARVVYPKEAKLIRVQLSDLIENKQYDKAKPKLMELMEADPTNPQWVNMMGSIFNTESRTLDDDKKPAAAYAARESALGYFLKANQMDSTNARYSYDAGAIMFNRGKAQLDSADELFNKDQRARVKNPKLKANPKVKLMVDKADLNFKTSRVLFEQALRHSKEKDDKISAAAALVQIYGRLKDKKNFDRIDAIQKELEK